MNKKNFFKELICSLLIGQTLFAENIKSDIVLGMEYSDMNNFTQVKSENINTSLQLDLYYKNYMLGLSSSYYDSKPDNIHGMNDTSLNFSGINFLNENLNIVYGTSIIFPTYDTGYDNNKIDYSLNSGFNYKINEDLNVFAGIGYTFINDEDIQNLVSYQNTYSYYFGTGIQLTNDTNINLTYNMQKNQYENIEDIKSVGLHTFTYFNDYFLMMSYKKGLSDSTSDNTISLKIGYNF